MQCNHCGQHSDWVGQHSDWEAVNASTVVRGLYECEVCGHRQRAR